MKVTVVCPACQQAVKLDEERLGETVACLRCNEKFTARPGVPAESDGAPAKKKKRKDDEQRARRAAERRREAEQWSSAAPKVEEVRQPHVPWYLYLPALLPLGIPVLTLGGLIPGAIGGGFAGACVMIARKYTWPAPVRVLLSLVVVVLAYGAFLVFIGFLIGFDPLLVELEMWATEGIWQGRLPDFTPADVRR